MFFLEVANKQIGNFLSARLRDSLLDSKSELLLKNLLACTAQKLHLSARSFKIDFFHELFPCVIEKRKEKTLDFSSTTTVTASPQRFSQCDANKSSPVTFCHIPGWWTKKTQKNFTIRYSVIRIANWCFSLSEQVLLQKRKKKKKKEITFTLPLV